MSGEARFAKSHEWVMLSESEATIGISEFAVEQLGDVVFVELPAVGKTLSAGDTIGDIESVKAVSQIYAPVSGSVSAVNSELDARPELVNQSPMGEGWIIRLKDVSAEDLSGLMSEDEYKAFLAEEGH